jgi:uncharacterized membrane protein (Fun14 family)
MIMVDVASIPPKPTLLDQVKNLNFEGALETLKSYPFDWVEIGSCAGIGLLSGFLFRKYFRTFLMTLLFGVLIIAVLDRLTLVHIDWDHVQNMIGIQPTQEAFQNLFQAGYAWVRINVQAVSSFTVGFIVGYKIG